MQRLLSMRRVSGAYRTVFATPEGRLVLKDMMRVTGLFRQSGPQDAGLLQYQEGARDTVRRTLRLARLSDDQLDVLMEEAADE